MRILVISDLHAHQLAPTSREAPSYYSILPKYSGENWNPIASISRVSEVSEHGVDWIMCPGDYGDRNDSVAQEAAWKEIKKLKANIKASRVIGAIGNHDVDSRRNSPEDLPDQELRALRPAFPLYDSRLANRFWRDNSLVHKFDDVGCTLVLLNSCAFHGTYGPTDDVWSSTEYLRGRVTENALNKVENEIQAKLSEYNILMLHHHLRRQPWMESDQSHLANGEVIVELLKATRRRWLIVHGHQHVPRFEYADGHPNAPVVLSAGSVAAKSYAVRGVHPKNQMHLIELKTPENINAPGSMFGIVLTWNWSPGVGWVPARKDSGVPHRCGFGSPGGLPRLADQIVLALNASPTQFCRWKDLAIACPEIDYIVPSEHVELSQLLRDRGVRVLEENEIPQFVQLDVV